MRHKSERMRMMATSGMILLALAASGCGTQQTTAPSNDGYGNGGFAQGNGQQPDGSGYSYYNDPFNNYSSTYNNGEVSATQGPQHVGTSNETGSTSVFRGSDGSVIITTSPPPSWSDSPY